MLRDEAYVPFHVDFSEQDGIAKVITGPNMAGKAPGSDMAVFM